MAKNYNNHLATRVSNRKKGENSHLVNDFIAAFMNQDAEQMESLLSYRCTYLRGKSKWETLEYFTQYWHMLEAQKTEIVIEEVISMDYYPVCSAYRFKFIEFMGGEDFPSRLTLVPVFESGQLSDLAISKRAAPVFVQKRLMRDN